MWQSKDFLRKKGKCFSKGMKVTNKNFDVGHRKSKW